MQKIQKFEAPAKMFYDILVKLVESGHTVNHIVTLAGNTYVVIYTELEKLPAKTKKLPEEG